MAFELPPFVDATLQAGFMGALSNVLAQYIESLKVGVSFTYLLAPPASQMRTQT
jgi:hypothetical protein